MLGHMPFLMILACILSVTADMGDKTVCNNKKVFGNLKGNF